MRSSAVPRKELLARKREQALIKRIVLIGSVCLVCVILLAMYAIPAMVKIADVWDTTRNSNVAGSVSDSGIPLAPPYFDTLPNDSTNIGTVTLKGFGPQGTTIHLKRSGNELDTVVVDSNGSFTFGSVSLNEGANPFLVYAQDSSGKKSSESAVTTILLDTQAPRLEVLSPNNGDVFSGSRQQVIEIKGKTNDATEMYVNESRVILSADGSFSQQYQLQPGENTITLYAKDTAGNKSPDVVRKVQFNP